VAGTDVIGRIIMDIIITTRNMMEARET
jgi:hypothetical protein